jgi:hypothetical protein
MTINDPAPEKGFFQKCLGENCFHTLLPVKTAAQNIFQMNSN